MCAVELNREQKKAVDLAKSGHSFLLTGCAGTGKTSSLNAIVSSTTKDLLVCGSTGLSCLLLSSKLPTEKVLTVHSAFGLMDGRYSLSELIKLYSGDDSFYVERRKSLEALDCLVIDEISMISSYTLATISRILQFCKGNDLIMGGVQRIFCGDFLQLPPVHNEICGDPGEIALLSSNFMLYVPHKVHLEQIVRTTDHLLSQVIKEVSLGVACEETVKFLESKDAPLNVHDNRKLVLYGFRENVMIHNAERLSQQSGQLHTYHATDVPEQSPHFRYMTAQKTLELKVGAPVMLIRNISSTLVNGLRGNVTDLDQDSVTVDFHSHSVRHTFKAIEFTRYSTACKVLCSRLQIPLVLCYAMTVHKAQGMTAEFVEVHAFDMYYPALLAVAIGRVTSSTGLRIVGFNSKSLIKPSSELLEKVREPGKPLPTDNSLQCCTATDGGFNENIFDDLWSDDEEEDSLLDSAVCSTIAEPSTSSNIQSEAVELLNRQIIQKPVLASHQQINADVQFIQQSATLISIYNYLQKTLTAIYTTTIHNNIQLNKSNGEIRNHFISTSYQFKTQTLSGYLDRVLDKKYHAYISELFTTMSMEFMAKEAAALGSTTIVDQFSDVLHSVPVAGKGTIRRIGGRTMFLMRKELVCRLREASSESLSSPEFIILRKVTQATHHLMTTVDQVKNGKYPQTAEETERRSYNRGGLTHITDEAFEYFLALESARCSVQTISKGLVEGRAILANSFKSLTMQEDLLALLFKMLPPSLSEDKEAVRYTHEMVIRKFLPVGNNTYRQRLLHMLERTKTQAHRRRIQPGSLTTEAKKAKLSQKSKDVDSECRARPCQVLRTKQYGNIWWVECSGCIDWYHLQCTDLPPGMNKEDIEKEEWYCHSCRDT